MANEPTNPYDISLGDTVMIVSDDSSDEALSVSLQLVVDVAFDGTTSTAKLIQSNDRDLPVADWNDLPESPLTLITGSNLLQTRSFICKYLGVAITKGDATVGSISHFLKIKKN